MRGERFECETPEDTGGRLGVGLIEGFVADGEDFGEELGGDAVGCCVEEGITVEDRKMLVSWDLISARSSDRAMIQDFNWCLQLCRQWWFVRQSTEIGIC